MLDKLKKYKYILLLLVALFILFLPVKNVNADSSSIEYNSDTINVSYFNSHQNAFLMYDNNSNTYLSFALFRTSNGEGSNPRFYVVKEDENYIYISGRSNQYFYNCTAVCNYNISTGLTGSVVSSVNYAGSTSGSNSNNGSYKIDKNRYSFVYKGDNTKIYADETCSIENTTSQFFFGKAFPSLHIEYYEPYSMYYAFTDWYDLRNIKLDNSYAYGEHTDYNPSKDEFWEWSDMVYEYKENEEGKKTITREGFPLNVYSFYSFLLVNTDTQDWVIKGLDFSEEALKGTEYENCLNPFTNLNLYLGETQVTPTVYSNFITKDLLDKCHLVDFAISFDNGESFSSINIDCREEHVINDITYVRFYYKLFANDKYTFRLRLYDENYNDYEIIKTFTINSYENIVDINGNDTTSASPFITAYADTDIIRFTTQTFKERISLKYFEDTSVDTLRYTAYYIDEEAYQVFGDNFEDWILLDVGYEDYDKIIKGYPYYFKTEFSFDSLEDGDKFYFVFYDNKLGCFSQVTTYTLESKQDLLLVSQDVTFNNDKFQRLYDFFKQHFGFLSYPFEFVINLLHRVFNINYGEPVLHFPQITNPLDDTVIFEGFDYNFKSILEIKGISYFYNIYLIAVDAILIFAFIKGCLKTFEEVSSNG